MIVDKLNKSGVFVFVQLEVSRNDLEKTLDRIEKTFTNNKTKVSGFRVSFCEKYE